LPTRAARNEQQCDGRAALHRGGGHHCVDMRAQLCSRVSWLSPNISIWASRRPGGRGSATAGSM
jgi:hypothetical protein